ncbi:MAG: chemotaxis protein CheD [Desulfosarcina sp.]|nr:chemotaxis protein CheD [Desulfobacterales bacterium]
MMRHVAVVADMKLGQKRDVLVTHALGSCLGLMVYDPSQQVGGLLHAMLPLSKINPEKAAANPYMFVDAGVAMLFKEIYRLGGDKKRLVVKAAGCGQPLGGAEIFKIGERNFTVLEKLLLKDNILLGASDVGGHYGRTVHFDIATGEVQISSNGAVKPL